MNEKKINILFYNKDKDIFVENWKEATLPYWGIHQEKLDKPLTD